MLEKYKTGKIIDSNKFIFEEHDIIENDSIYKRIYGKSFQENDYILLKALAYIKLLHYGYDGKVRVGELIIHKAILF